MVRAPAFGHIADRRGDIVDSALGPRGVILSTPLTVCLLVLGRNLPQLRFLDTMLGSTPALDVPPVSISG